MSNQLAPISGHQAPALARQKLASGGGLANNFSQGVFDSYPVISIKGKIFSFRFNGETHPHVDANRFPIPYLDVVLVNGSPNISKVYYEKGFSEGDNAQPDCFSMNGIKPDPSSPRLQNPVCASCKWNQFGSKITPSGKQAKACADSRRIVVVPPQSLGGKDAQPIMLRVPQSSTKNLKEYVTYLERNGFLPNSAITRMSFDVNEAYPRLNFQFAGALSDQQYEAADQLTEDERTLRILAAPLDGGDVENNEVGTMPAAAAPEAYATVGATAPAPQPVQAAPAPAPVAQAPAPVAAAPAPAPQQVPGIIALPDGRFFDPASGQFVPPPQAQPEPTPAPAPAPVSQQAAAPGPAFPSMQSAPMAAPAPQFATPTAPVGGNPFGSFATPGPAQPMTHPGMADTSPPEGMPAFLGGGTGPVIDGTVAANPVADPVPPKKRTRTAQPPAAAAATDAAPAGGGMAAPASLDALLGGLIQK